MGFHAVRRQLFLAAVSTALLLASASAEALLFRAYLASDGNDANPCTLAAPCRLLPAALAAVADGGEIWMLDSANYNTATVTIGKSVSILAIPGAVGSVVATGGSAINIAASDIKVALHNLMIVPLPGAGGHDGISMTGASLLTIEKCLFANIPHDAVYVSGTGILRMTETIVRNSGSFAVELDGGATGDISFSKLLGNVSGILVFAYTAGVTAVNVSDSIISGGADGVFAYTTVAGATPKAFITRSTISGAGWGIESEIAGTGTAALIVIGSSMITNNYYGWYQHPGATIESLGNNLFRENTTNVGSLTPVAPQ